MLVKYIVFEEHCLPYITFSKDIFTIFLNIRLDNKLDCGVICKSQEHFSKFYRTGTMKCVQHNILGAKTDTLTIYKKAVFNVQEKRIHNRQHQYKIE